MTPLARNQQHYTRENPAIKTPDLVLVSGDFVAGVKLTAPDASAELTLQYTDAETFLSNLAGPSIRSHEQSWL